ncbi:MAG: universal stress protein [Phycisphaeraceae bacterium]|nr:MAG: universal stress protein [Phycisphaeraceae bacterium]
MFRHALVAVDFSPAWPALLARLHALRELGVTEVTLVHVLSTRYPLAPAESHREHYESRLSEIAQELSEMSFNAHTELRTGEPGYELAQAATDAGADLILAGNRGTRPLRDFFLGSTALDLARLTDRPLWLEFIGDGDASDGDVALRSILLATDGSDAAGPAEECFVKLAAQAEHAIAIHVVDGSDEDGRRTELSDAEQSLTSLAERVTNLEVRVHQGDAPIEIVEAARRENADVVIVGKRGRSLIRNLLLGSVAEAVCRRSRRSVLLVPVKAS